MKIEVYRKTLELFIKDGYEVLTAAITHECHRVDDITFTAILVKGIDIENADELTFKFTVGSSNRKELENLLYYIQKIK